MTKLEDLIEMDLQPINKKELIGKNFKVVFMCEPAPSENGWYRTVFVQFGPDDYGKFFISADSAMNRPEVVGHESTIIEKESESGNNYFMFAPPVRDRFEKKASQKTLEPDTNLIQ